MAQETKSTSSLKPDQLQMLKQARPGDLLLFNRAKKLNRMITWFTRSNYYHVAIFKGGTSVVEARPRGVVERDLNGPDGDKSFVVIPAPGGEQVGRKALEWAEQQVGDGYDPINVAAIVLDRSFSCWRFSFGLNQRYSCGELVAEAFQKAGEDLFPDCAPESIVPSHFEKFLPLHAKSPELPHADEPCPSLK